MPRRRHIERLEDRRCMTTWGFVEHPIDLRQPTSDAIVADVNGDGRDDLIVSLSFGIGMRLAEPNGFGWQDASRISGNGSLLEVADVDGDNDLDVMGTDGQRLFWLENQNSATGFVRHEVAGMVPMEKVTPNLFESGDVNGDGKLDGIYLANSQQLVTILDVTDPVVVVSSVQVDLNRVKGLQAIDVTGDQADEVIVSGIDHWYAWDTDQLVAQPFPPGLESGDRIYVDLDQDQFLDVIVLTSSSVEIYELQADRSRFEIRLEHLFQIPYDPTEVKTGDYNGDGRTDIFLSSSIGAGDYSFFQVMTQDHFGQFTVPVELFGHPSVSHNVWRTGDIDGRGDDFLFFFPDGGISAGSSPDNDVARSWPHPVWMGSGDLDGDGDVDLVTSADYPYGLYAKQRLLWYENLDGRGTYGSPQQLTANRPFGGVSGTGNWNQIVDWDRDGRPDIVGQWGGELYWYRNRGSEVLFAERQTLVDGIRNAWDFEVADLDQDGSLELIGQFLRSTSMVRYEQLPDSTSVGPAESIANVSDLLHDMLVSDIDADGMSDLVAIRDGGLEATVVWLRNRGDGKLDEPVALSRAGATAFNLADFDNDGDLDLFVAERLEPELFQVYLNSGTGAFTQSVSGPLNQTGAVLTSLHAGDLDGDEDVDLVVGALSGVFWFENERGLYSEAVTTWSTEYSPTLHMADVNGDGQLDWISAAIHTDPGLRWHEKRLIGDVNGDGLFNSADLIALFEVNQYEDSIVGNSTFLTGDFDGDGEFSSTDLVLAFQAGVYQR